MMDDNANNTKMNEDHKGRTIGIMFGSYNPPHMGHVKSARGARITLGADTIIMVPINSIFKKRIPQARYSDKINMCQILANDNQPWLKTQPINDMALRKPQSHNFHNYFNFLSAFQTANPHDDLVVLCGMDNEKKMRGICAVFNKYTAIKNMILRMSIFNNSAAQHISSMPVKLHVFERATIRDEFNGKSKVSSSLIRQSLNQNDHAPKAWMHSDVLNYIIRHKIFGPKQ